MTTPPTDDERWSVAAARGALYEFCVRGLAFPSADHEAAIRRRLVPLLRSVEPADDELARRLGVALDLAEATAWDELGEAHSHLFTAVESQDCPPYETSYSTRDVFRQTDVMADVAGFYRAHGVEVGGVERERPDHVAAELDFMSFMARKEAFALAHLGADEVAECARTQDLFLTDHLGCWAPSFGSRAAAVAEHPFHAAVGALVHHWVLADMAARGVEPAEVLDDPLPPPEPDDGECGPTGGPCPVPAATTIEGKE